MRIISKIRAFISKSILNRLVISFVFILLLPTVIISYLSYSKLVNNIKENYYKDQNQILNAIDTSLQMYFDDFNRLTYNAYLARDSIQVILNSNNEDIVTRVNNINLFNGFAPNLVGLRQDVEGVYLYTMDGYLFDNSRYDGMKQVFEKDYDISEEDWMKNIINNNIESFIIGSHRQGYKSNPQFPHVITIGRKITSYETGKVAGIFFIDINLQMFQNLLDSEEGNIIILDNNNNIVYDKRHENISKNIKEIKDLDIELIEKENHHIYDDGNNYIIIKNNEDLNLKYIKIITKDQLIQVTNQIALPIIWTSIICFIALLAVAIGISRNITNPIKVLKDSMKRVQDGDFNQKVEINNKDEIGSLANNFNIMIEKIQDLISKVYETQLKKMDSEFRALQAQINPHFLYNTLESINCLALISGAVDVSEMIQGLGRMFRYSIKQEKNLVTLEDELNHVKDYILLQAVRYDDKFDITYNVPDDLLSIKVIKFILQPIVENAIYHGLEGFEEKGHIKIEASCIKNDLQIKITNNGNQIDSKRLEHLKNQLACDINNLSKFDGKGKSIGIFNIHLRLQLQYGKPYGLSIDQKGGLTEVKLLIPMGSREDTYV